MTDPQSKFERFMALHTRDRAFVIANPSNASTARLLTHLGFESLAKTSAGYAFARARAKARSDAPRQLDAR
ncbi:hypothetical protein GI374_18515 [Paracoccus sp. S-4012]|uniref:hypothetical protein n=1 Tax=Paracoccus sp. S-4012 TaxID=2665648 RepID=UPI0012B0A8CE|nr:hypothetical protein [Paracoccus sp. S-4012]MRX52323.1 hypothetical protein [Paracoccus sp. S-4012]